MVVWKPDWKKPGYGPKCSVFDWSRDFTIWILETHTVWYSDESSIQVFGIQMVIFSRTLEGLQKRFNTNYDLF